MFYTCFLVFKCGTTQNFLLQKKLTQQWLQNKISRSALYKFVYSCTYRIAHFTLGIIGKTTDESSKLKDNSKTVDTVY